MTPKRISDTLPQGATIMTPQQLNNLRFSKNHTVLTPRDLASTDEK